MFFFSAATECILAVIGFIFGQSRVLCCSEILPRLDKLSAPPEAMDGLFDLIMGLTSNIAQRFADAIMNLLFQRFDAPEG
jgi:hypothetical protein